MILESIHLQYFHALYNLDPLYHHTHHLDHIQNLHDLLIYQCEFHYAHFELLWIQNYDFLNRPNDVHGLELSLCYI